MYVQGRACGPPGGLARLSGLWLDLPLPPPHKHVVQITHLVPMAAVKAPPSSSGKPLGPAPARRLGLITCPCDPRPLLPRPQGGGHDGRRAGARAGGLGGTQPKPPVHPRGAFQLISNNIRKAIVFLLLTSEGRPFLPLTGRCILLIASHSAGLNSTWKPNIRLPGSDLHRQLPSSRTAVPGSQGWGMKC